MACTIGSAQGPDGATKGAQGETDNVRAPQGVKQNMLGEFVQKPKADNVCSVQWSGEYEDFTPPACGGPEEPYCNAYVIQMMDFTRGIYTFLYIVGIAVLSHWSPDVFTNPASTPELCLSIGLDVLMYWPAINMVLRLRSIRKPRHDLMYRWNKWLLAKWHSPKEPPFTPMDTRSHAAQNVVLAQIFLGMAITMRFYKADEQGAEARAIGKLTPALYMLGNVLIHSAWFG